MLPHVPVANKWYKVINKILYVRKLKNATSHFKYEYINELFYNLFLVLLGKKI